MENRTYLDGPSKIAYRTYGVPDGSPVLILHGLFGMADNWHTIAGKLVQAARDNGSDIYVVVMDLPDHGFSPWVDELNYRVLADAVVLTIRGLGLVRPVLMGHSMGGKTAMLTAALNPQLISGLIVVDIAPRAYPDGHSGIIQALEELPVSQLETRQAADAALAKSLPSAVLRSFLLKNLRQEEAGYSWLFNIQGISQGYSELRSWHHTDARYDGPMEVIAGAESDYIQPARGDIELIQQYCSDAGVTMINGAGHWVHSHKREEFLRVLTEILSKWHIL
ncbi:alpha/beta fold hydrolase [Spirochaeta lutea]|uniref:AB hydrolase-1 domain-containing protein n=1 Tax=Spirochaeta lutea TaxID=1480694 RepID=A0A098R116_9SPIO|nr:alpha/beta fold hydrolase [Spirochaeta lutea]KGE73466.1 hypothetical protein DC28_03550 [Spirochaeta lutea]